MADMLPIDSDFGSKVACDYTRTWDRAAKSAEDFILLTPKMIMTSTSYCEIVSVLKVEGQSFSAKLKCQEEGESGSAFFTAQIERESDGFTVAFVEDPAIKWGPLAPCK